MLPIHTMQVMAINCDNATNNDTMMDALERHCCAHKPAIPFSTKVAQMWCVPHTVHLAALQVHHLRPNISNYCILSVNQTAA